MCITRTNVFWKGGNLGEVKVICVSGQVQLVITSSSQRYLVISWSSHNHLDTTSSPRHHIIISSNHIIIPTAEKGIEKSSFLVEQRSCFYNGSEVMGNVQNWFRFQIKDLYEVDINRLLKRWYKCSCGFGDYD